MTERWANVLEQWTGGRVSTVLSVNVARHYSDGPTARTGIDKRPTTEPVPVGPPGAEHGSGLSGDLIGDRKHHGGDDQAVYAYAREDLDTWEATLKRPLSNGMFGENLTTSGIDVTNAVIGERWRVGSDGLVLEVTRSRTPCRTFTEFLGIPGWVKTFTTASMPGAYLRVIVPGSVRAGDSLTIIDRPDHGVTVRDVFRAMTTEPDRLPGILAADALADEVKQLARRRLAG